MIRFENISKVYYGGGQPVTALHQVNLEIARGDFVAVMGPSGSGKSTLLHLMGTLDESSAGEIYIDGIAISTLKDYDRTLLRRHKLGFVFQFFHLLPTLTALENVAFPALLDGAKKSDVERKGRELLARVGLSQREQHRPDQLSGGEMQRVAIARALIMDPPILLADEPTGNLDTSKGEEILLLLQQLNQEHKKTIAMVTHDLRSAQFATRTLELKDGMIFSDRSTS